jgi:hypothetical protein
VEKGTPRHTVNRISDDSTEDGRDVFLRVEHADSDVVRRTGTAACFGTHMTKYACKDALVHRPIKLCVQRKCRIHPNSDRKREQEGYVQGRRHFHLNHTKIWPLTRVKNAERG